MAPASEENGASLESVEEGVPATNSNLSSPGMNNNATNSVVKRQGSSRLSMISKKYDIDGDGKLDEAEQVGN